MNMEALNVQEKEVLFQQIRDLIQNNRIVLFMKGTQENSLCGFSAQVAQILNYLGVPFKDVDVMGEPGLRSALKEFSSWPTFPQLYVDGRLIGGCDIVREMFDAGELQKLLTGAPSASSS